MLVDHVLLAVAAEDHGEGVIALDGAPHLEAVDQKDGDRAGAAPDRGEENVLKCFCLCHVSDLLFM